MKYCHFIKNGFVSFRKTSLSLGTPLFSLRSPKGLYLSGNLRMNPNKALVFPALTLSHLPNGIPNHRGTALKEARGFETDILLSKLKDELVQRGVSSNLFTEMIKN